MLRIAWVMTVFVLFMLSPAHAEDVDRGAADIMCGNAPDGSVVTLPSLVTDWVTILCTPTGQALAPLSKDRMVLWMAKNGTPFVLDAVPRSWQRPDSMTKYDMRFVQFSAVERTGDALDKTLKMWDTEFGPDSRPKIDRVVQLDAQSVLGAKIYNLFFYIVADRPKWVIACMNQCQVSASIQVVEKAIAPQKR